MRSALAYPPGRAGMMSPGGMDGKLTVELSSWERVEDAGECAPLLLRARLRLPHPRGPLSYAHSAPILSLPLTGRPAVRKRVPVPGAG